MSYKVAVISFHVPMIRFALPFVVTQILISWRIQNIIGFAAEAHGVSEKPVHLKFCNVWVRVKSFNVVNGDGGHIHINIPLDGKGCFGGGRKLLEKG